MLVFVVRCLCCACVRARVCVIHWHCSAQMSMFNMEKRYRNKIIIIIIIISVPPIMTIEVKTTLKERKNNNAPGIDNLASDVMPLGRDESDEQSKTNKQTNKQKISDFRDKKDTG